MALAVDVRLLQGRYEAAVGGEHVEWPPHPARLFCALLSVAESERDRDALRWLERQAPPQVWAPELKGRSSATSYVVTNKRSPKGGSQHWPGRTTIHKERATAVPGDTEFAVVWEQAEPDAGMVETLGELAWRVPYLGRASNPAALRVHTTAKRREDWQVYAPVALDEPADGQLRVPYPGYVQALDTAFEEGQRAWEVAHTTPYALASTTSPSQQSGQVVPGPFSSMLVFSFPARVQRPAATELLQLTQTLRQAVLARIGDTVAPQIAGHTPSGQRHLGYIGLPNTGHDNADGHLLGLGLLLPADLEPQALGQLRARIVDDPLQRLTMGRAGHVDVTYEPWPTTPRRLNPRFWAGERATARGSRCWTTATPLMLDHYTRPNSDLPALVTRSLVTAGYPEPSWVEVSAAPLTPGALHRPARGTFPPNRPRRKLLHACIVFDQPVRGPVVAGSMRYLGLGLFAPTDHLLPTPECEEEAHTRE
ncbi:type I-G CRISPR-associated protein Csb2 [Salinactinospora qingdaonensis]|uniref:CRISPR-associated protein Csb2 n=1 Tax=Salinactinospora qingdaonensis TaxID=702744 RepID=A0ABP7F866_9ACTN